VWSAEHRSIMSPLCGATGTCVDGSRA
jgi:hypothetical protein